MVICLVRTQENRIKWLFYSNVTRYLDLGFCFLTLFHSPSHPHVHVFVRLGQASQHAKVTQQGGNPSLLHLKKGQLTQWGRGIPSTLRRKHGNRHNMEGNPSSLRRNQETDATGRESLLVNRGSDTTGRGIPPRCVENMSKWKYLPCTFPTSLPFLLCILSRVTRW